MIKQSGQPDRFGLSNNVLASRELVIPLWCRNCYKFKDCGLVREVFANISKESWKWESQYLSWMVLPELNHAFLSIKWLEVLLLPLDGMPVHHRLPPCHWSASPDTSPVPLSTPGLGETLWDSSVLPKNITLRPRTLMS